MAADVAITNEATVSAPKDYKVPGTQQIKLRQITAEIDGSGTAAAYLPVVELVAPGGAVMGRWFDRNVSIAAGGSATCTWFPGVAATTTATTSTALKFAILGGASKTFTGNGGSGFATTIFSGDSSFFYTSDTAVFEAGTTTIGGGTYYGISVKTYGHYLVWPNFSLVAATAGNPIDLDFGYYASVLQRGAFDVLPLSQAISSLTRADEIGRSEVAVLTADSTITLPSSPIIYQCDNYTNYAPQALVTVFALRLDTDQTVI